MTLYNLKTDGDHYRITKFTNDLEVESSYLCSEAECECPAGHRPSCRHRQMLPVLLAGNALNNAVFYDFDTQTFYQSANAETSDFDSQPDEIQSPSEAEIATALDQSAPQSGENPPLSEPASETAAPQNTAEREPLAQSEAGTPHPTIGKIERRI